MDVGAATTLISIGEPGASLTVTVRHQATKSPDEPWFDTEITADASPFGGTVKTVFTMSDLRRWQASLAQLRQGVGRSVLGGDRAAELVLEAQPQEGGGPDHVVLSVELTPSGDDPYPALRYLIFDVLRSWPEIATSASTLG